MTIRERKISTFRTLWPFLKPERPQILMVAAISLGLIAIDTATPLLIGVLSDSLLRALGAGLQGHLGARIHFLPSARFLFAALLIGAILQGWAQAKQRMMFGQIGERVVSRIRSRLWQKLQRLPLAFIQARGAGRILLRLTGDTRSIKLLVTEGILKVSQDLLLGGAVLGVLFWLNWRVALGAAAILPLYALLFYRQNSRLRAASRETRRKRSRLSGWLNERIVGLATLKIFARERREARRNQVLNDRLTESASRLAVVSGQFEGVAAGIVGASTVLVLALIAGEVVAGRLSAGSLIAFLRLFDLLPPIFHRLIVANRYFQESRISVERIAETLAMKEEAADEAVNQPLVIETGEVRGDNLSFRTADGATVLDDFSFAANRGELVAIEGPNGAGKSLLVDLLLRFNKPAEGQIRIDGHDIASVTLASLRSQIGVVMQDNFIFDGSIRKNLLLGIKSKASQVPKERLWAALAAAGLDDFVRSLPRGLDTRVGSRGRALSTGQKASLALARALVMDPPILLADDAGASWDRQALQQMASTLRRLSKDKTVIVTTRRPEMAAMADRIYDLRAPRAADLERCA